MRCVHRISVHRQDAKTRQQTCLGDSKGQQRILLKKEQKRRDGPSPLLDLYGSDWRSSACAAPSSRPTALPTKHSPDNWDLGTPFWQTSILLPGLWKSWSLGLLSRDRPCQQCHPHRSEGQPIWACIYGLKYPQICIGNSLKAKPGVGREGRGKGWRLGVISSCFLDRDQNSKFKASLPDCCKGVCVRSGRLSTG